MKKHFNRLWHQLTLKCLQIVQKPELKQGNVLIEMYENKDGYEFNLEEWHKMLNPLNIFKHIFFFFTKIICFTI